MTLENGMVPQDLPCHCRGVDREILMIATTGQEIEICARLRVRIGRVNMARLCSQGHHLLEVREEGEEVMIMIVEEDPDLVP